MKGKSPQTSYVPLTIDAAQTKANVLLLEGTLVKFSKRYRTFSFGTLSKILAGKYKPVIKERSTYQRVLRLLNRRGYLVQLDKTPLDKAA